MSLVVSALVRNEADKYLASCLDAWSQFADKIVVLDDFSTDGTRDLLRACDKVVWDSRDSTSAAAWGMESHARMHQWELTMKESKEGDWLLILDADMVPARDPRDLIDSSANAIAFALFDLWDREYITRCPTDAITCINSYPCKCPRKYYLRYRDDSLWCGHRNPRVWMVKRPSDSFVPEWNQRGIHCGHAPRNLDLSRTLFAPRDYSLLHYAYADEFDRRTKHAQYMSVAHQLGPSEMAHAMSILDPSPNIRPLPFTPQWPITKTGSARTASSGSDTSTQENADVTHLALKP